MDKNFKCINCLMFMWITCFVFYTTFSMADNNDLSVEETESSEEIDTEEDLKGELDVIQFSLEGAKAFMSRKEIERSLTNKGYVKNEKSSSFFQDVYQFPGAEQTEKIIVQAGSEDIKNQRSATFAWSRKVSAQECYDYVVSQVGEPHTGTSSPADKPDYMPDAFQWQWLKKDKGQMVRILVSHNIAGCMTQFNYMKTEELDLEAYPDAR